MNLCIIYQMPEISNEMRIFRFGSIDDSSPNLFIV